MHRYKNSACLGRSYREGADLASDERSYQAAISWIYVHSSYDYMCVQVSSKDWDETSTFYVISSFSQASDSIGADAFKLVWSKQLQCYQPVQAQQHQEEFVIKHPELVSNHYSLVLTCAYAFVSYLHIVAEHLLEAEARSLTGLDVGLAQ